MHGKTGLWYSYWLLYPYIPRQWRNFHFTTLFTIFSIVLRLFVTLNQTKKTVFQLILKMLKFHNSWAVSSLGTYFKFNIACCHFFVISFQFILKLSNIIICHSGNISYLIIRVFFDLKKYVSMCCLFTGFII